VLHRVACQVAPAAAAAIAARLGQLKSANCRWAMVAVPEKINTNLQSLEGEKKTEVVPPFVKICNKDLANRPSFVVLEDALERNRIKQDSEQCQKSSHAESQTGETGSKNSVTSTNNVSQRGML